MSSSIITLNIIFKINLGFKVSPLAIYPQTADWCAWQHTQTSSAITSRRTSKHASTSKSTMSDVTDLVIWVFELILYLIISYSIRTMHTQRNLRLRTSEAKLVIGWSCWPTLIFFHNVGLFFQAVYHVRIWCTVQVDTGDPFRCRSIHKINYRILYIFSLLIFVVLYNILVLISSKFRVFL